MKSTLKKTASKKLRKKLPAPVMMGVPTIEDRLNEIEASVLGTAGILGMSEHLSDVKLDVAAVSISESSARVVCRMLSTVYENLYWLQCVKEVANTLAPTDDQRESFEKIRGAR